MPRYSLNLRQKYGKDELAPGEVLQRGVAGAIESIQQRSDARRTERNTMAAAGAAPLPDAPQQGIVDRVRGIGAGIGRVLHGSPPPPIAPTPPFVPPRIDPATLGRMAGTPTGAMPAGFPTRPSMSPTAPPITAALSSRPTIASAIEPYTVEGIGGSRYAVDPMHAERQKQEMTRGEEAHKQTVARTEEDRQVAAAVATGMPESEARLRVQQGLMRYDDTYGQQRTGRGLSVAERKELIEAQGEQARLTAKSRTSGGLTPEERDRMYALRERSLDLREAEIGDRQARGDVNTDVALAGATRKNAPPTTIVTGTSSEAPADRAAREKALRDATRHTNEAAAAATRLKNSHATRDVVAARAKALMQQFGNDRAKVAAQLRAEGFKVQ